MENTVISMKNNVPMFAETALTVNAKYIHSIGNDLYISIALYL